MSKYGSVVWKNSINSSRKEIKFKTNARRTGWKNEGKQVYEWKD